MSKRLQTLILMACKEAGCYDPAETLFRVEEIMTAQEYKKAHAFLAWVNENSEARKFGPANLHQRVAEYKQAK